MLMIVALTFVESNDVVSGKRGRFILSSWSVSLRVESSFVEMRCFRRGLPALLGENALIFGAVRTKLCSRLVRLITVQGNMVLRILCPLS